jgi:hypothetical protein
MTKRKEYTAPKTIRDTYESLLLQTPGQQTNPSSLGHLF